MIHSILLSLALTSPLSLGQQKKINLDDVKIQGEGMRGSQIDLGRNGRTDLEKHLTIRRNFRKDIVDALPVELEAKKDKKTKKEKK